MIDACYFLLILRSRKISKETINHYVEKIREHSLLSLEEEFELSMKIQSGCEKSREKLILANLRFVIKLAHEFTGLGLPLVDLISEGNLGLMKAAEKFDPRKGAKFSSYSSWWIRQSIRRGLANNSKTIRIPIHTVSKLSKIKKAKDSLSELLNRDATYEEISKATQFPMRTILALSCSAQSTVSLQTKLQVDNNNEIQDIIEDKKAHTAAEILSNKEKFFNIKEALNSGILTDREKLILELRYGFLSEKQMTLEDVSKALNRTRERIRQIQVNTLKKLKLHMLEG